MTEEQFAKAAREKISELLKIMNEGQKAGFTLNFNLNTDPVAKVVTLMQFSVAKSYL